MREKMKQVSKQIKYLWQPRERKKCRSTEQLANDYCKIHKKLSYSNFCTVPRKINNDYDKKKQSSTQILGDILSIPSGIFHRKSLSLVIFGDSFRENCSKIEYLVNTTFYLQFFKLFSEKPIIGTQKMT